VNGLLSWPELLHYIDLLSFFQKFLASKSDSKPGEKPKTLAERTAQVKKDVEGVTQV